MRSAGVSANIGIEVFTLDPEESLMNYISRQKRLADLLRRGGFDALLVTHLPNILYLCGFTGTAGVLLFQVSDRGHKATFYTDGRYDQQAHDEVKVAKVVVGKKPAFVEGCEG